MSRTYLNNACQECDGTRSRVCGKLIFIVLTYMRIKHESFIQLQTPISAVVTGTWKFPLSTSCCLTNRRQLKGMLLSGLGATGVISSSRPVSSVLCQPVFGRGVLRYFCEQVTIITGHCRYSSRSGAESHWRRQKVLAWSLERISRLVNVG